jgi:hypothetical protein
MSRERRQEKGAAAVLNRTPEIKKAISSSTRAAGIQAASRRKSRSQHISEPLTGGLREQSKITRAKRVKRCLRIKT